MKRLIQIGGLLFLAAINFSCSTLHSEPEDIANNDAGDLSAISVVSSGKYGFELKSGDSFSWRRDVIWLESDETSKQKQTSGRDNLTTAIEDQFLQKGYFLGVNTPKANFEVVAATILGKTAEGDVLTELAQLSPGLNSDGSNLEKGTILIGISRVGSSEFLWRASLQGFVGENFTPQQQLQRLNALVKSLLMELPES